MFIYFFLVMMDRISIHANQNSLKKINRKLAATLIDCANYATTGDWSYIIYDVDFKCYDANPDQALYSHSGNLILPNDQQIYFASKEKVFTCDVACIACYGPTSSDCIECVSPSRGSQWYPTVADIISKKTMDCPCRSGYSSSQTQHCTCPQGKYEVKKTNALWDCFSSYLNYLGCPFIYVTCTYDYGRDQVTPLTCKTGIGRSSDPNLKCNCENGYHENSPIIADCIPDCQKPCSLCQVGSNKLCSQCYDGLMLLNSTTFECLCPTQYYMNLQDFKCYACDYTCMTCNGGSNANCQSCIPASQRQLLSGYCLCPEHYVISSQLNCVQCDWSCNTCFSTSSCQTCMPNDNRYVGPSGYCVCQDGFAEDLGSATCVKCIYTCLTCEYQYDTCTSCPQNSMRLLQNSQCICQDYYYDAGNLECQQCDFTCQQCDGPMNNHCLKCDSVVHRFLTSQKQCLCLQGYGYIDESILECQLCSIYCLTCDQIDKCLTCPQNTFRVVDDNQTCICDTGYYQEQQQLICLQCHFTCQTCDGGGPDKCLSCNYDQGRELNNNQCKCQVGYYEFYKICTPCFYTCLSCVNQFQDGCTSCPSSRKLLDDLSPSQCVCNSIEQIDDGKSLECTDCDYTCQTCYGIYSNNCITCYENSNNPITTSRELKYGSCNCPLFWFDDGQSESCKPCHYSCQSCFDQTTQGCITCSNLDFRVQLSNSCFCQDGYFEIEQQTCQKCDYRCETCVQDKTNCLTCPKGSLRNLTLQNNSTGYQTCACTSAQPNDMQDNPVCQACHFSCSNCTQPQSNFCTICSDQNNRWLIQEQLGSYCYCKDSYYEVGTSECASCSSLCYKCITNASKCTECDPNMFRVLNGNTCICGTRFGTQQLSYYDNNLDPECIACHYSCFTCSGEQYNQCLQCSELDFRNQQGSECVCNLKYIDNGEPQCMSCDYSCDTCEGTKFNCTSCLIGSLRVLNVQSQQCECPLGYYDSGVTLCSKCDIVCDSCSDQSTTCLSCVIGSNRVYNPLTQYCDCLSGYFDVGDGTCSICHLSCFQCNGPLKTDCLSCPDYQATQRVFNSGSCQCADQYYDDSTNKICQICSSVCYTCQNDKNYCTQCIVTQNRTLFGSSCICLEKYYDSGSAICQPCSDQCLECLNTSTQCKSCDTSLNRYLILSRCQCLDGYFEDLQLLCQLCHFSCQKCVNSSTNCTSCNQNDLREYNNGQCHCIEGSIELGTKLCGICDQRCKTCSSIATQCLSCDVSLKRILSGNDCVCIDGYFENNINQCQQCNQQCKNCINSELNCTFCDSLSHKVIGPQNSCICDNGYYTDSNNNCHLCSNLCLLCQESPTKCTSCNLNRILVNNSCLCLDGSYNSGLICLSCSYTCKTCQISANNCTSCNLNQKRIQQGSQCICENGYYDIGSEICQICSVKCLTCVNDATNCQSCDLSLNRIQNGNQCSCQPGYFDNGSAICQVCDKQCATCNQQSNRCTSCNVSNTFRVDQSYGFNKCPCMIGFYDDQEAVCKKCSYQCINCEFSPTNCTLCNNNPGYYRIDIIPSCVCQDGYFDDGLQVICEKCNFRCQTCTQSSQNCLTCENPLSRNQAPTCDCKQGYYLQIQTQKCLECSIQCETCTENANNCKSCKPDRITKNCNCQDGYYEANLQNCQLCSPKCQICENHQLNCKVCASNRMNPPNCLCKDHYYDDYINIECQICDQYCKNCNINGCIDCAANRILNGSSCSCPIDSTSYLDTPWCSNCDVAVVDGRFSDDLLSILYKFEFPILFHFPFQIDTQEYCEKIISQESLTLIGQSPKCLTQDTNLIIQLGDGATIQVNDKINFDSTYLRHPQCSGQLSKILRTEVKQPINLLKPQIELEYPQNPISPCSEIQLAITKQFTSGQRNLIIQWQSPITLTDIEQANLYQFQTLTIQQGQLPENQVNSFSLQFKNFLGQSDYLSINITTLSSNTPQFLFQGSQQQFFLWTPVKLIVFYSNQICSQYQTQKISDQIEINLQELSMYRSPLTSRPIAFKQSQFYFNDSENMLSVIIPAGTLSINSNYSIQASYKDSINNIQLSIQKDIQISKSPLIVQIVGGTRIQNYLKDFTLEVQAKDPDFQTEWNVDPEIGVEVSCIDIQNNNQPCKDVKNRTIHLNNTQFTQNIGKRLFNPFSVLIFKTICKKQSLIGTDQVSIIFLDIDIPSLNVQYPLGYKIRDVNINEKLQFEIELSKYQYVKNIEFSYALVYNYEIVSVQSIPNSKLKFKIWDDFINFGNNNKISLRLQSHDINYLMPQTFSIQLTVNRPPVNSIISIQPQIGDAFFTQYKIKVQNAKDEDSPIQYHFAYYQSESLKNIDILQTKEDNLITLQDFSSSQTYTGILESGDLVLLIQVSDSLGSTRNYTQQINSKSFREQISQQNISCTSFIEQFSDQAYDYQRQIILVQELVKLMNGSQDCITQIKFLLSKLKQSMLIEMRSQKNLLIQQRINNALSQIYNIDYSNSRKLGEKQQQSICLDVNTGNLQFDTLNQINDGEESVELGEILNSLAIQIGNSIVQNTNLLQDYQSSIDLGDEQTSRLLQQNFNLRQSYLKVLGSLYSQAYKSKLMIRNLVNKLMDSFQQNIETDKPGIKLVTTSIGVQISKISQITYQKYLIPDQNVEEILDLSTYLINRIVQFSVYSDNFYQYSSQFQNQFKVQILNNKIQNGSYLISELNNSKVYQQRSIIAQYQEVTYDPFIYVEIDEIMNQMKKIYQGKLAINMKQEISQCDKQINTTVHKYSYACSTYDNEWKFDQCQLQQQLNKNGKIVLYCLCKTLNPVTLMILNETQVNKPQNQKLNLNINVKEYIKVGLNYNIFNIIILASAIVIILTILIFLKISYILIVFQIVIQLETKITEPVHPLTEQPQMSTQLFNANFKFLHEILRIFMTRYTYLSQQARILLILLNIGMPLTLLNLFVTILGQYNIPLIISLSVAVMFQVVTKIFEGFFTGPIALKIFGYILTIALNLGMLILNEFIIENNHQQFYDILSALLLLLILYGPCEILIQYLRLKWAFKIYKEFTIDPMNPILNLIYYFFQDEIVICIVKGAKLS